MEKKLLVEHLIGHAKSSGSRVALRYKEQKITYAELWDTSQMLAGYLRTLGIQTGDHIVLEAVSEPVYVYFYIASQIAGAVIAPVERGLREERLSYLLELVEAKVYFTKKDDRMRKVSCRFYDVTLEEARNWAYRLEFEQPEKTKNSEIVFTTGTTGHPKAALHSYEGIICNTNNTVEGIGMRPSDIILLPLPLNHSFGLRVLRAALSVGACVVIQSGAIFADALIKSINTYECTALACVSATMEAVLREAGEQKVGDVFSKLRYIEFSAGAVPKALREKLLELLPDTEIHNTWGSTESGGCLFLNLRKHSDKLTAAGKALDTISAAIYSEKDGRFLEGTGEDKIGRLAIRGDMIFKGYWKQMDLYQETVVNGWLITNDLVWRDSELYYYILGRADDVINIGGEKVAPAEIENAAYGVENLKDCACIGVPDKEGILGEIPVLFYTQTGDLEVEALKQTISRKIGIYKVPRKFIRLNELPQNYMKKKDYKQLKKLFQEQEESSLGSDETPSKEVASDEKPKKYVLHNEVVETILRRKSRRHFTGEEVPKEITDMLIETGKCAPSGKNLQTRRFTVISRKEDIQSFKELIQQVANDRKTSFRGFNNPPLLILISNDRRNKDGIQDVGVAAENIMIAAESYGLGGVWLNPLMDISDEPLIRERLESYKIPASHIVWAVMAIGWPAEEEPEFFRKPNEVFYVNM